MFAYYGHFFEEDFIDEMLDRLDTSFGSRTASLQKFIDETKKSILNLRYGLAYLKVEEVAALVRRGEPNATVQQKLHQNFPAGVSTVKVDAMLKLVYVGADCTENLIKAINFVQVFESEHHAEAYKSIYEIAWLKVHTTEPEMLLLKKKIDQLQVEYGTVLDQTKMHLNSDCCKIISRIVADIYDKDYSISKYIANSIESELLNDNILLIVCQFSSTLENTLLLIQYADGLPHIENICFVIDALLKKLEKGELLATEQSMHLWAFAKFYLENPTVLNRANESVQKFCSEAVEKLSQHKNVFFRLYQKYIEDSDSLNIKDLHKNNRCLLSMLAEFVSFYYNWDPRRAQRLLEAARVINQFAAAGRILTQLYIEMAECYQLSTFEGFRILNEVKRYMNTSEFSTLEPASKKLFEQLKHAALPCVRRLLWPESTCAEFLLVNKFFGAATPFCIKEFNTIVCFATRGSRRYLQAWRIAVDSDNSLLTLTNARNSQEQLDVDGSWRPCLTRIGAKWMVNAIDQHHIKIFCNSATGIIYI